MGKYRNFKAESDALKRRLAENGRRELGLLSESLMVEIEKKMLEAPPHLLDEVTARGKRNYEDKMRARMDDLDVRNIRRDRGVVRRSSAERFRSERVVLVNGKWGVK